MKHSIIDTETREEILDAIAACEEYLANANDVKGKDLGRFAHVFADDSTLFAREQIAFEKAKLRIFDLRAIVAEARADESAPARLWTLDRLDEIGHALDRWALALRSM